MSAVLIAAQKIQSDIAGLTGAAGHKATAAATSATEVVQRLFHGESGSLHYLWDSVPVPVSTKLEPTAPAVGGSPHPDIGVAMRPLATPFPVIGHATPQPVPGPVPVDLTHTLHGADQLGHLYA